MRQRLQEFNWGGNALGAVTEWSQPLKTLVELMLSSTQPMFMAWGPERIWLYNDAFIPILGQKHPAALGSHSNEVWSEAWEDLEPLFSQVFAGRSIHLNGFSINLNRRGRLEEAIFDFSYTPVRDDSGELRGLFGVC